MSKRPLRASLLIPLLLLLVSPAAYSQSCSIQQTSARTGTTIEIDLQTGCSSAAEETFGAAALFWADFLYSPVTITVEGNFRPLTCNATSAVLGSAGPYTAYANFTGAPASNVFYPKALANAFRGADLNSSNPDIVMQYNSAIGTGGCLEGSSGWYLDDGSASSVPSGYVDLYGVAQHELGHGLGFLSYYGSSGAPPASGYTDSYSQYLYDELVGQYIKDMSNASRANAFVRDGNLTWQGGAVDSLSGTLSAGVTNNNVRMYAPNPYASGSSVSHFDTAVEPGELMEPIKLPREDTGFPLTKNLFRDLGWKTLPDPPTLSSSSVTSDSITVAVAAPAQNGGSAILNYTVTCGAKSTTSAGGTITVTGLQPSTQYSCVATTNTGIGSSDQSAALAQTTSASSGGSCLIERESSRTGTSINIELQTGCTAAAEETFGAAALYWADFIYSPVPIDIRADFKALTCDAVSAVLGSAGAWNAYRNFSGAPLTDTFYAVALANSLRGSDLDSSNPDIVMQYNNAIGTPGCYEASSGWYMDDGTALTSPAGYVDLYGTIQHEIGHGLGFASYYTSSGTFPVSGATDSFSQYLYNEATSRSIDNDVSDPVRSSAFISQSLLTWSGPAVDSESDTLAAGNTNGNVRMYAPNPYQSGSSVSHFDTVVEPSELMEPFKVARASTNFHLTRHAMRDIGWITLPEPPVIALDSVTTNSLTLSITPPNHTGGRVLLNYTVRCGATSVTSASTTITVSGLSQGAQYDCYGWSNTAVGQSDPSNLIRRVTHDVPDAFIISTEVASEEITFRIGISVDHGLPITLYTVSCSDGTNTYIGTSTSNNVTVSGLINDTSYSCSVAATNSIGMGPYSVATTGLIPKFLGSSLPIWLLYEATQ